MTALHTLRAAADDLTNRQASWSVAKWDRHDQILHTATHLLATYRRATLTLATLARAMDIPRTTFTSHFITLDALLAEILRVHITTIQRTLENITEDIPNHLAARRAEYFDLTRTESGPAPAQKIWLRDRASLPPDLLEPLEAAHAQLATLLAPPTLIPAARAKLLALMDNEAVTWDTREEILDVILRRPANHTAEPAETPAIPAPKPVAIRPARVYTDAQLRQLRAPYTGPDIMIRPEARRASLK